jgi:hypothetical protein
MYAIKRIRFFTVVIINVFMAYLRFEPATVRDKPQPQDKTTTIDSTSILYIMLEISSLSVICIRILSSTCFLAT